MHALEVGLSLHTLQQWVDGLWGWVIPSIIWLAELHEVKNCVASSLGTFYQGLKVEFTKVLSLLTEKLS